MEVYKPLRDPVMEMMRLKNFIVLLVQNGLTQAELMAKLDYIPVPLFLQAINELTSEGRILLEEAQ